MYDLLKKTIIYYSGALLCTLIIILSYFIGNIIYPDNYILINCTEIIFKILIIIVLIIILIRENHFKEMFSGKYFSSMLLISLIYILYNILNNIGPMNYHVNMLYPILGLFGVITTVIWEEIYFRHFGKILFTKENKVSKLNLTILAIGFGLPHLANAINTDIINSLYTFLLASSFAIILMSIYLNTNNIFIPMTIHFALNISSQFFLQFRIYELPGFFESFSLLIYIIIIFINFVLGIYLYNKYAGEK